MSKETVVGGNGGVLNEANKMPVQEQKSLENNEGMYYVYFFIWLRQKNAESLSVITMIHCTTTEARFSQITGQTIHHKDQIH